MGGHIVIGYLFLPTTVAAGAGCDVPGDKVGTLLADFEKLILDSFDSDCLGKGKKKKKERAADLNRARG